MNAIEYLKENLKENTIITKDIVLAKFKSVENNYKHSSIIPSNILNIVYKGTKTIHSSKKDIKIESGEAFFITKGEYVMSEVISDEAYECLIIFFDHEIAKKIIGKLPFELNSSKTSKNENLFKFKIDSSFQNTADSLKVYLENKPKFAKELITLKLEELILLILGSPLKDNFISFCQNLIANKSDLKSFMEDNFERDLNLKDFARLSGRSLSAFKNEFKNIFKETPMKWIIKKRLEKARFLIQELNYEVGTAALRVGFKTHAHFSRVYKKEYGYKPSFRDN